MAAPQLFDRISRAIVSLPGKNLASASTIGVPDEARAAMQHQKYVEALKQCGVEVTTVAAEAGFPNACLIGNTAVVTEHLAVIGNFSNYSARQGEQKSAASALAGDKFLKFVTAPGLLDAEDVLRIRNHFYIGLSERTNHEGAAQLAFFLKEFGYEVTVLEQQPEGVRLSTGATWLGGNSLLVRQELSLNFAFLGFDKIVVPYAGGAMINGTLLLPRGYAETAIKARGAVSSVIEVNISEFQKMGGSLRSLALCLPKVAKENAVELPGAQARAQQSVA